MGWQELVVWLFGLCSSNRFIKKRIGVHGLIGIDKVRGM